MTPKNLEQNTGDRAPSYYAVIPASVRYDRELRPNAKLLYGELSALAAAEGYCWASNAYFAELFDLSAKTVAELIRQLAERGHIRTEVVRDTETHQVQARKIWITGPAGECVHPSPEKSGEGSPEKMEDPPPKNPAENNTSINNTSNIPPKAPQGAAQGEKRKGRGREPKTTAEWKPERFEAFWKIYPRGESRQTAIRAWDKLRADDALLEAMGRGLQRAMGSEEWQRGIGIPYAATWLNNRRWEDTDKAAPCGESPGPTVIAREEIATW